MSNPYLEKVAANAYKRYLASKGQNVSGISNQSLLAAAPSSKSKGAFTGMSSKANKMGVMPSVKPSVMSRVNQATGRGPTLSVTGSPLSMGAKARMAGLNESGKTLGDALKAHAMSKQTTSVASGGVKGILGKAIGFAKKNPLLTAGAALAGGALAGSAMSRKSQPSYEQMQGY
ncbi:MAG TPA: hypothetical protein VFM18_05230 [Methanosarcina sp.]|nr:hypothetical protein [Methanosarcina sp.]